MWIDIVVALIAFLGGGGVTGLVTVILQRRWKVKDEEESKKTVSREEFNALKAQVDAQVRMTKINAVDRIRYLGRCYISCREIAVDDKQTLLEMYRAYKGLGGNGDLEVVMAEVDKLPVVESRFKRGLNEG